MFILAPMSEDGLKRDAWEYVGRPNSDHLRLSYFFKGYMVWSWVIGYRSDIVEKVQSFLASQCRNIRAYNPWRGICQRSELFDRLGLLSVYEDEPSNG